MKMPTAEELDIAMAALFNSDVHRYAKKHNEQCPDCILLESLKNSKEFEKFQLNGLIRVLRGSLDSTDFPYCLFVFGFTLALAMKEKEELEKLCGN